LLTGVLGLVLSALPAGLDLEEHLGLNILFTLRGPTPAPADVVVVSLDKASADALQLPSDPVRWPRLMHARLTDNLARAGARVIAFDFASIGKRLADGASAV
jgi:adenylate cyclase